MRVYCAIKGADWLFPGDRDKGSDALGVEGISSLGREAEEVVKHPIAVLCEEGRTPAQVGERGRGLERYAGVLEVSGLRVVGMVDEATSLVLGIGEGLGGLEDGSGPDALRPGDGASPPGVCARLSIFR